MTVEPIYNWGLGRISAPTETPRGEYVFPRSAGENVDIYIVDSGIRIDHKEFDGGRAINGYTAFGNAFGDELGHGTFNDT